MEEFIGTPLNAHSGTRTAGPDGKTCGSRLVGDSKGYGSSIGRNRGCG
jgi:hypothetical protein